MRAIKIKQCNDSKMWYAPYVGCYVPLLAEEEVEYKSREPAGYVNFVQRGDGEVVYIDEETILYHANQN